MTKWAQFTAYLLLLDSGVFSPTSLGLELFERRTFFFSLCMLNAKESRLIDARNRTILS